MPLCPQRPVVTSQAKAQTSFDRKCWILCCDNSPVQTKYINRHLWGFKQLGEKSLRGIADERPQRINQETTPGGFCWVRIIIHDATLLWKKRGKQLLSLHKEARKTNYYRSGCVLGLAADCYRRRRLFPSLLQKKNLVNLVYHRRIHQGGSKKRWTSFRRGFKDHRRFSVHR